MATVKRISDSYSIVGTDGNTAVYVGSVSQSAQFTVIGDSIVNGNLVVAGNTVINSTGIPVLPTYLSTALPPVVDGGLIYLSDIPAIAYGNAYNNAWFKLVGVGI